MGLQQVAQLPGFVNRQADGLQEAVNGVRWVRQPDLSPIAAKCTKHTGVARVLDRLLVES